MSEGRETMNDEPLRMDAYYYGFRPTGVIEVDRILSAVARAGKAYHETEQWNEPAYGGETSPVDWIQDAANAAAASFGRLVLSADNREALIEVLNLIPAASWDMANEIGDVSEVADVILSRFALPVTPEPTEVTDAMVERVYRGWFEAKSGSQSESVYEATFSRVEFDWMRSALEFAFGVPVSPTEKSE